MVSLYDVLKASKVLPAEDPIAGIWGRKLAGGKIQETEGALPLPINANGEPLIDYKIYGNTIQNGTPTPDNPVDVMGCGVRTENLFDINSSSRLPNKCTTQNGVVVNSLYFDLYTIPVSGNTRYYVYGNMNNGSGVYHCIYDSNDNLIGTVIASYKQDPQTFTTPANAAYMRFSARNSQTYKKMLTTVVATEYIPFGYQLNAVVSSDITTENEFPFAEKQTITWGNGTIESDGRGRFTIRGTIPQGDSNTICLKEPYVIPKSISQGGNYCFYIGNPETINGLLICFYDTNDTVIETWLCSSSWCKSTAYTNMAGKTIAKIGFRNGNAGASQINAQITPMFSKNTTLTTYIPYRYSTDIPIFIGSTPLEQGEYVDYGEQKVYKYVDGVLIPTDPPVALPTLPTLDGTTVIDFNNSPKPEKMYVKYRKH